MTTPTQDQIFHRTELLLGKDAMQRIRGAKIIIFGVGGVGSWAAEALVRTGFMHLTIVDSDVVCATNVNRQLQATFHNVGKPKVDELKTRLLAINPEADIKAFKEFYDEGTSGEFDVSKYDYVLDAIDSLKSKILLIKKSLEAGVKLYSSMGAGVKLDPTQIRTVPISKTKNCPLARVVRQRLRKENIQGEFMCVYSEELPVENKGRTFCGSKVCACPDKDEENLCMAKAKINGTLVHITAPFGFTLAGLVIQDIARGNSTSV
ncbi:MAG TPA: tRNA threonylcarbamoyladenosine dehydratase [Lentisphaeria bacterium]|nr:MAG: hypothetical protein A2X48_05725 [Lentisphaerae bacterium GWF2_49_21]HBC86553.1 tRNA threonylcarbamoyladenosine dehydratase [Lentisphaeria bacterium]